MSSCLSGGGRPAYKLDLEIIKSPSTSWTSNSSSPTSTLSESSNSPIAISTRKPRTHRKRPNQTYNEAAALLSTAYPKIFSAKHLTRKPPSSKFTKPNCPFSYESSDMLLPFQVMDHQSYLLQPPNNPGMILEKPSFPIELKMVNYSEKPCRSPGEIDSKSVSQVGVFFGEFEEEDFDTESILDEEIEQGIDSIMGNLSNDSSSLDRRSTCYGYPIGLGLLEDEFGFAFGMRKAHRYNNNNNNNFNLYEERGDWWRFPSVNVHEITPKLSKVSSAEKKKKKKKKVEKPPESKVSSPDVSAKKQRPPVQKAAKEVEAEAEAEAEEEPNPNAGGGGGLLLKLNYDGVLDAWSDKELPFLDESLTSSDASGNDIHARLAQVDLFPENGVREASVMRYKEKRRTRLFSKKIRYQVRKVNADRRPRMKGRFVRSPNSPESEQG